MLAGVEKLLGVLLPSLLLPFTILPISLFYSELVCQADLGSLS